MFNKNLYIAVLAAGKGTRMKSDIPKVMFEINKKPMLHYVIKTAKKLNPQQIYIIVGYKKDVVMKGFNNSNVEFIIQKNQKGTAHAIMQGKEQMKGLIGNLLILSGDVPLIKSTTLKSFIKKHNNTKAIASIITTSIKNPKGYGRIIRDQHNKISMIIEHKDASNEQKKINEINTGIYIFDIAVLFRLLPMINNDNNQNEYYLPDVIKLLLKDNKLVETIKINDSTEFIGVNSKEDLKKVKKSII